MKQYVCSVCGVSYTNNRYHEGRKKNKLVKVMSNGKQTYEYHPTSACDRVENRRIQR